MKAIIFACTWGLVLATDTIDITLDGAAYTGDDLTSWLNDCTASVQAAGCTDCVCTEAHFDDEVVITVTGDEQALDKLDDSIEENGITIDSEGYYVEEEEEEDGTMTLVVTMTLFVLMCICGVAFFACMPWPNSPEKIAERERLRREEKKEKKAEEQAKSSRNTARGTHF